MSNSLYFLGNTSSYISIPNNTELNFEEGDFTVEWFQYQTDANQFPRIFQKGTYEDETVSIGVSIEGGRFYYWRNNGANLVTTLLSTAYKNKWVHFAICRSSGITKFYMNGVSIYTLADTYNYTNTENLLISNESNLAPNTAFGGYMYYFHYIKGVAKYTANFTVSTAMVSAVPETVLLLTADGASGSLGNTVTNNAGTYAIVPELSSSSPPAPAPAPARIMHALFTDNSRVYYKTNSLASGGIGGVRNHRRKARRT
jgi:hypothetical protein